MTLKDLRAKAKAIGMTIRWNPDYREYRVNFPEGNEATAYYTGDRDDALATAERMLADRKRHHAAQVVERASRIIRRETKNGAFWVQPQPEVLTHAVPDAMGAAIADGHVRKFSGTFIPAIGDVVEIDMNAIGNAIVVGYFHDEDFVGILAVPVAPPAWWIRQDGEDKTDLRGIAAVFGCEYRAPKA